jgi:signal transduction histidine kinase
VSGWENNNPRKRLLGRVNVEEMPPKAAMRSKPFIAWVAMVGLALASASVAPAVASAPAVPSAQTDVWSTFDSAIANSQKAMMADPGKALEDAKAAASVAQRQPSSRRQREALATSLWLQGEALTRTNRVAEARIALNKASALAASDGKLTKLDGDLAMSRGNLADASGDVAGALKSYQQAHAIFVKLGNLRSQALSLVDIGRIYDEAHDFAREFRYCEQALQIYSQDPALALSAANNVGFALEQMGRYGDAIANFNKALKIAVSLKSPMLQARILTNIGMDYAREHKLGSAEAAADHALKLLGKDDPSGWAPFVWAVKAEIEYRRHAINRAVADIDTAFHGMNLSTTIAPYRDAHEVAYRVYRAAGNLPLAIAHLEAFKRLDDEGRSLAASANSALLGAKFDFATQQLEIARLQSAKLERDISLRKSHAVTQMLAFLAFLVGGLILIAWTTWRHAMVRRHRKVISLKNVELTKTLAERDGEIARRTEVESQLRLAMQAAQQANRAKSHFLANMSHELRTPLNAIIGFSELLSTGNAKAEKTKEYAAQIAEGGRHLLLILNDILEMARLEAGRVEIAENIVPLRQLVEDSLSAISGDPRAQKRIIQFAGANADVLVRGDETRLRQVLVNLLSNGVKFTPENGTVDIAIERVRDGVDVVVRDNGIGIAPEKLAIVMEPFGQVEGSYARSHGGTGLGLPIARSLIELHGGRFTIVSEEGGGTEARVHLPYERIVGEDAASANVHVSLSTTAAA